MSKHYDIIIIGSGAGGGTLAHELAKTGESILILERGEHLPQEPENWDAKAVFVDKRYRTNEQWIDKNDRAFTPNTHYWVGGNTTFYGAALMRMKRGDFEEMQHCDGPSPAWPLKYHDLAPYYTRAESMWRVHGQRWVDPFDHPDDPPFPHPPLRDDPGVSKLKAHFKSLGWTPSPLPLGVNRNEQDPYNSPCIRCRTCGGFPCLLKAKSDARSITIDPILESSNVTLLTGKKVAKLLCDSTGKMVNAVVCEGQDGPETFSGDVVVLAAGAVNSAAILLRSEHPNHPNGLANRSDQVGRNYMFHTTSAVVSILAERFESTFPKTFSVMDFYYGEPDGSYPYPMGQIQLLEYMSGATLEGQLAHIIPPAIFPDFISDELAKHMVAFLAMTEDLPHADNRVTLTKDGQIRLSYTPNNLEAHRRLTKKLEAGLAGFAMRQDTMFEPHFEIDELLPLYGTAHQCGTLCALALTRTRACLMSIAKRMISTISIASIQAFLLRLPRLIRP